MSSVHFLNVVTATRQFSAGGHRRWLAVATRTLWIVCALAPTRALAQTPRTTANQGLPAHYGWNDPSGNGGLNVLSLTAVDDKTVAAASRVYDKLGDPTVNANLPAYNGNYTVTFKLTASTPPIAFGGNSTINAFLTTEYSTNSGASWTSVGGTSQVTASRSTPGQTTTTQVFSPTLNFAGGGPVWIRLILRGTASGNVSAGQVKVQIYAASGWSSDPYAVTWATSAGAPAVAVAVRAELPERQHFAGTNGSQRFFVKNLLLTTEVYNISIVCSGTATACSVAPAVDTLAPYESGVVIANYTVGVGGTTGAAIVKAILASNSTKRDSSTVALRADSTGFPVVSVVDVNPGASLDRGECLTVAAGAAAAFECGDLRIVHALPAFRTLNKSRVPTLIYNSALADPYPIVAASVTLASVPDSVEAILFVGGLPKAQARWAGTDWLPDSTRRIALGTAELSDTTLVNDTTKVIDYTLEVATILIGPPGSRKATTVAGRIVVANRRRSSLGAGWWLAGLERISVLSDSSRLWVGGDGSFRLYTSAGTNLWVAPNLERPDTLRRVGTSYVRRLPGGLKVTFNSAGQHDTTVNRLGHRTVFSYSGGRLTTITLPSQGGVQSYSLAYDGNNRLSSVTATPGSKVTSVSVGTTARLDFIRDPDNRTVTFGYESPSSRRITSRTNRRGTVTSYSYDAAKKLWLVRTPALQSDSIRIGFRALEVIGLGTATSKTATDTANAYASVYGARQFRTPPSYIAQETKFRLDSRGAVRKIVNVAGHQTLVKREDGQWAARATELTAFNGFVTRASYDGRGNLARSTAVKPYGPSSQDAVTRMHWDPVWDFADSIITPMGVVATIAYDPTNGNPVWQQVGPDPARRVNFRYYSSGLLSSTVQPGTPADSIEYDALGNLAATRTPKKFWTSFYKDLWGRDTLVVSAVAASDTAKGGSNSGRLRQQTRYDVMDRDTMSLQIGPAMSGVVEQTVTVRKTFDAEGSLLSLTRQSSPDPTLIGAVTTSWIYDTAGRRVVEIAPDQARDSVFYDASGNDSLRITRRHHRITTTYDALERLISRTLPSVPYAERPAGISTLPGGLPTTFPAYQVPGDTQTFTYDELGRLLTGRNADARIKRNYYPNGLIKTDSLWIRTVVGWDSSQHAYGLSNVYNLDGGRVVLGVPVQLGMYALSSHYFSYETQTGLLSSVTDLNDAVYYLGYNMRGEVATLTFPSLYQQRFTYDVDGRLIADTIRNSGGTAYPRVSNDPVRAVSFAYDARGKMTQGADAIQFRDTLNMAYSGLGHLVSSSLTQLGKPLQCGPSARYSVSETFTYDGIGNRAHGNRSSSISASIGCNTSETRSSGFKYTPGTGRLANDTLGWGVTSYTYSAAGDIEYSQNLGSPAEERASYYAADGTLRAVDFRRATGPQTSFGFWTRAFDEYRYDALGRRIWLRSQKSCQDSGMPPYAGTECATSVVRRAVWDGDNILAEIQMPGASTTRDTPYWENDTAAVQLGTISAGGGTGDPNGYFGRVVYTHAGGVDHPVSVTRYNYVYAINFAGQIVSPPRVVPRATIVPFWDRQGDAPFGVFTDGGRFYCNPPTSTTECVGVLWMYNFSAYDRQSGIVHDNWHGSLLENGRDKSGQEYRRNRYYDPAIGRFTQEDPLGLAGGLNQYGFAESDPVTFTDPFGLCSGWDITYDCSGNEIRKVENNLDHDRFYLAANGIVYDLTTTLEAVTVTAPDDRDAFQKFGDGLAGFGDFWTWGGTREIREAWVCPGCVNYGSTQYLVGQATALASQVFLAELSATVKGGELVLSDGKRVAMRINPLGHEGGPWYRRLPHYHRRGPGGIGIHRPWEPGGAFGNRF